MEPPMASFHRHAKTGTFTNSGNSRHRPCHRFRKRIQLLRTLPKNGITLPVDSHVYCCDPIFQYKLSILWLLGMFLKSARVISCTNDILTFDSLEDGFFKNSTKKALSSNYEWIPVWIRMNAQIGWFSTTNAFLIPKCYTKLQRFGMMAMAWYGIRCKTQGYRFRMIWQGISNVLFCYYVYSICLLCLNKIEGCLKFECSLFWERTHALLDFKNISWSSMTSQIPRCAMRLCCSFLAARDESGVGRVCPSRNRTAFGRCHVSATAGLREPGNLALKTASPCCAAIKTFDTHPLFDVLALLHIYIYKYIYIYIFIYIYICNDIYIYIIYFPGGQSLSHFMMIIAQNWMMDDGNISKKHIYIWW